MIGELTNAGRLLKFKLDREDASTYGFQTTHRLSRAHRGRLTERAPESARVGLQHRADVFA
jgi:hypothetical protein